MVNNSRIDIYDYLKTLFTSVSDNIYSMTVPTDNTTDDTEHGFLVTRVGSINDESEFDEQAYGWVRCYVSAYVPKKTRGRLNKDLYKSFEDGITDAIKAAMRTGNTSTYYVIEDKILSLDDDEATVKGNQYHVFIKSFKVAIDQQE